MYECAAEYARSHADITTLMEDDLQSQLRYHRQEHKYRDGKLSEVQAERSDALGS